MEIWKDIPSYEGVYQVSNKGRVRSLTRNVYKRVEKGRLMSLNNTCQKGYIRTRLVKENKRETFRVHQLVAMAFLGYVRNGKVDVVVDHINEIKTDNRVENLRLVSNRENVSKSCKVNKYGLRGVYPNGKRWVAACSVKNKTTYIGAYDTKEEAVIERKKYINKLNE